MTSVFGMFIPHGSYDLPSNASTERINFNDMPNKLATVGIYKYYVSGLFSAIYIHK